MNIHTDTPCRIAVIDDDPYTRTALRDEVKKWFQKKGAVTVTEFESGDSLMDAFTPGAFRMVFLDIRMEGTDGIGAARRLRGMDAELLIVFVTSSREYAFDAFPIHPFDYLLKPFSSADIARVLSEAHLLDPETSEPSLTIRVQRTSIEVPFSTILYAASRGHAVEIATTGTSLLRTVLSFGEFVGLLNNDERFLICNRGLVINMDHVRTMEEDCFQMTDGSFCPIRTKGRAELNAAFTRYQISRMKRGER